MAKKTTKSKKAPAAKKLAAKKVAAKKVAAKKAPSKKKAAAKKVSAPKRSAAARPAKKKAASRAAAPAPARKAAKRAAPARKAPARGKPAVRRRDGAGHIDPKYAQDLLEKSGAPEQDPRRGFVNRPRSKDDLVEELAEEFVEEATSAEHEGEDIQNQEVPEDRGGPFVETTGQEEFAYGTDLSNPKGAKREPFPTT